MCTLWLSCPQCWSLCLSAVLNPLICLLCNFWNSVLIFSSVLAIIQSVVITCNNCVLWSCFTHWINKYWNIVPRKYRVRHLWASSTHQYRTLYYMYFCSKKPYLKYIIDLLISKSRPTVLERMPEWSVSNTCIFSVRHIAAFLCSGTLDSASALCLGGHFRQQNHQ